MKNAIVKVIEYGLVKGIEEQSFLEVSAKLTPELAELPGFIKRELHKGETGRWRDVVYWETRADADRSELAIPTIAACVTCIAMMDHTAMTVTHFELAQEEDTQ